MKKILLFVAFVSITFLSGAQDSGRFGFRAGIGYSDLRLDQSNVDTEPRYGVTVSFFADYALSEKLTITPEIGYSYLGIGNDAEDFINNPTKDYLKSNWVQGITTLKYDLSDKFYIGAGGSLSLQIKSERDLYRHWDVAAIGLVGYRFSESFFVDFRYNHGFLNVLEDGLNGVEPGYNTYFQLGVGYRM